MGTEATKKAMSDQKDASKETLYNPRRHGFGPSLSQGQPSNTGAGLHYEDNMGVMMSLFTMVFAMCGMLMKIKWAGWAGIITSVIGYTSAKSMDDARQVLSSALLGVSSTVMCYMQSPGSLAQMLFPTNAK